MIFPPNAFPSLAEFLTSAGVSVPALLEAVDYYLENLRTRVASTSNQMDNPESYINDHDYLNKCEDFRDLLATSPTGAKFGDVVSAHDARRDPRAGGSGEGPSAFIGAPTGS